MPTDLERDLEHLGTLLRRTSPTIAASMLRRANATVTTPPTVPAERHEFLVELAAPTGPTDRSPRSRFVFATVAAAAAIAAMLALTPRDAGRSRGSGTSVTQADATPDVDNTTIAPIASPTEPAATTDPGTTVGSTTPGVASATSRPMSELAKYTGWYFPASIPDGFEVTGIDVRLPDEGRITKLWTRQDHTGVANGAVAISTSPFVPDDPSRPGSYSRTIHGLPANAFDSGEGIVVGWGEAGRAVMVRGMSLTQSETVAIAEGVVVDAASGTASWSPTAGFAPTTAEAPPADSVSTTIVLRRLADRSGQVVTISVGPNAVGHTLATRQQLAKTTGLTVQIERIGELDRMVQRPDGSTLGSIDWFEGGMDLGVSGDAPFDDLQQMAISMMPVSPRRLAEVGATITTRILALPAIEQATVADATVVSLRRFDGAYTALCVEGPVPACRWHDGAMSGSGLFEVFEVGGRAMLVGWHSGTAPPSLLSPTVTSADGSPTTAAVPAGDVHLTTSGQFVAIPLDAGAPAPVVVYGDEQLPVPYLGSSTLLRF